MSAVTYHGEFPEGQDTIVQHGYEFDRDGKSVNVKEPELLARFATNRFFKTVDSDKEDVESAKDEAEQAETETLKAWLKEENVPFHHKAGLKTLRDLREKHEDAKAKAQAD